MGWVEDLMRGQDGTVLVDEVADQREEQLVLTGEVPIEGLEGDAGLLNHVLGREAGGF